jgi:hypothetical protein
MAHYLTYLAALRAFLATGHPYALIMEDDLVRVRSRTAAEAPPTVHDAVRNAPPFDILFLEYCHARCEAAAGCAPSCTWCRACSSRTAGPSPTARRASST